MAKRKKKGDPIIEFQRLSPEDFFKKYKKMVKKIEKEIEAESKK